jgi:hypothetical protein
VEILNDALTTIEVQCRLCSGLVARYHSSLFKSSVAFGIVSSKRLSNMLLETFISFLSKMTLNRYVHTFSDSTSTTSSPDSSMSPVSGYECLNSSVMMSQSSWVSSQPWKSRIICAVDGELSKYQLTQQFVDVYILIAIQ